MRVGVSGTHGTGKTTLVDALCTRLAGHVSAGEPYLLLEEEGYEFEFPQLARPPGGFRPRSALGSLDLLVITPITAETERFLPAAELPRLREEMNDALLELVYRDPLQAWGDVPVIELSGPLDQRLAAVLGALGI